MMKLCILSSNQDLINSFKEIVSLKIKSSDKAELVGLDENDTDFMLVGSEIMSIDLLLSLKSTAVTCFYLSELSDTNLIAEKDESMLSLKNICIVPPERNIEQIRKFVLNKIFNIEESNNIFCFFGADSKVGTTGISQLVATKLAKRHIDKTVLLLFLGGQTGFDWVEDNRNSASSLSDIQIALKNNHLTKAGIKDSSLLLLPNFLLLKGERRLDEAACYHQDEISSLLEVCKKSFDFIVIDSGDTVNLDLRMTYSALFNSSNNILITDQLPKSLSMFKKAKNQVLKDLKIDNFKFLVLNKYLKDPALHKKEEIVKKYELPILTTLPYIDYHYQAAAERNLSILESDAKYREGVLSIAEYIEAKLGFGIEEKTKKSIFGFWGGK